jgi:hypothetical protein
MNNRHKSETRVFVGDSPLDMGRMICDVLLELGIEAWTAAEADCSNADLVILPSDSIGLELLESQDMSQKEGLATLLWLVDPLPPPGLSARAEVIGQEIAKLDWHRILPGSWGELMYKYFPFGREVIHLGRWNCIRKLRKEIAKNGDVDYVCCSNREWVRVMVRYYRLREYMRDGRIDYLFTTTEAKRSFLADKAYDVQFIPFGYHKAFGENLGLKRDIDVLFLGRINNKRRAAILHKLNEELTAENVKLKIVDKDCYGDERTQLLNRTKISLDLPRVPWDFGPERLLMSMSCCAMVVSEGNCPKEPFIKDVHYVQAGDSDLTTTILSYLRNEQQRRRITRDAYNYVTKEITLKKSVLDILQKSNLVDASQLRCVEE